MSGQEYDVRAVEHRPETIEGLREAAMQLLRDGLTDHDVAQILELDVNAVRRLVGECIGCEQ